MSKLSTSQSIQITLGHDFAGSYSAACLLSHMSKVILGPKWMKQKVLNLQVLKLPGSLIKTGFLYP